MSNEQQITHLDSAGWLANAVALKVNSIMAQALEPLGLTQGHFAILKILAEADNITQTDIGKAADLPGYAMTRNLDVLEQRGLLLRHPDQQSRRSFRICLTEAGKALSPQLFAITRTVNDAFLEPLGAEEAEQLRRLLKKLLGV